ncbi:hypothetical protein [Actinotalea sp.]|uniref:hypothetical protein n=1 Tax=Actinotalea sp. TaxID=1872145 RepID=UPI002BD440FF|nr:hypothetical protein [Actinotalea sp.]HQY33682.1 hypothetical protein [Actinotalea sp.]HRA51123.1 hypothetical protein [Actinotalea sp.]
MSPLSQALLALGAGGTIGGAVLLVAAFRRGQAQDRAGERRLFRSAVAALAVGSLLWLATIVVAGG